jgi:hypothetical protein
MAFQVPSVNSRFLGCLAERSTNETGCETAPLGLLLSEVAVHAELEHPHPDRPFPMPFALVIVGYRS